MNRSYLNIRFNGEPISEKAIRELYDISEIYRFEEQINVFNSSFFFFVSFADKTDEILVRFWLNDEGLLCQRQYTNTFSIEKQFRIIRLFKQPKAIFERVNNLLKSSRLTPFADYLQLKQYLSNFADSSGTCPLKYVKCLDLIEYENHGIRGCLNCKNHETFNGCTKGHNAERFFQKMDKLVYPLSIGRVLKW